MKIVVLTLFSLFLFSSTSFSGTRCLDEELLRRERLKTKTKTIIKIEKQYHRDDRKIIWKMPKKAKTVTFHYKDKNGNIVLSRTFEVDEGYTLEMEVN